MAPTTGSTSDDSIETRHQKRFEVRSFSKCGTLGVYDIAAEFSLDSIG